MKVLDAVCDLIDPMVLYRSDRVADGERPWVLANMVAGLDGSTAVGGRVGALSGDVDSVLFKRLRTIADAVLVGAGTVRAERYGPILVQGEDVSRRAESGQSPVPPLVIVTGSLELDWSLPLFSPAQPVILATTNQSADSHRSSGSARAEVLPCGDGRVDLHRLLSILGERGHRVVLCEGGPRLLGGLLDDDLVDELCLTLAPMTGGDPLPVAISGGNSIPRRMALQHVARAGDTLFLRYERSRP